MSIRERASVMRCIKFACMERSNYLQYFGLKKTQKETFLQLLRWLTLPLLFLLAALSCGGGLLSFAASRVSRRRTLLWAALRLWPRVRPSVAPVASQSKLIE